MTVAGLKAVVIAAHPDQVCSNFCRCIDSLMGCAGHSRGMDDLIKAADLLQLQHVKQYLQSYCTGRSAHQCKTSARRLAAVLSVEPVQQQLQPGVLQQLCQELAAASAPVTLWGAAATQDAALAVHVAADTDRGPAVGPDAEVEPAAAMEVDAPSSPRAQQDAAEQAAAAGSDLPAPARKGPRLPRTKAIVAAAVARREAAAAQLAAGEEAAAAARQAEEAAAAAVAAEDQAAEAEAAAAAAAAARAASATAIMQAEVDLPELFAPLQPSREQKRRFYSLMNLLQLLRPGDIRLDKFWCDEEVCVLVGLWGTQAGRHAAS
jgi:hypothetical protein